MKRHITLQFSDTTGFDCAANAFSEGTRDDESLALDIPTDGSVGSLKRLLDRFEDQSVAIEKLSIHTPDLDDVFFALTGNADRRKASIT